MADQTAEAHGPWEPIQFNQRGEVVLHRMRLPEGLGWIYEHYTGNRWMPVHVPLPRSADA